MGNFDGEKIDAKTLGAFEPVKKTNRALWFSSERARIAVPLLEKDFSMRSLMRVIAAVMRSMKAMVKMTVKIGDRLISMLVPAPMPLVDELEPDIADNAERDNGSVYMPVRNLAYARLSGTMPTAQMLVAAGKLPVEWISAMPKDMLKKVLLADDARLHRHMRGIETIRGVLRFDEAVIDDYRISMLRERAREEVARRTMTPVRYA